jgi:hypothetical protein
VVGLNKIFFLIIARNPIIIRIFVKQYHTMKNTIDKQTEQFYQEALKQFKGDEKAMMEYFKKVLDYQKNKK